MYIDNTAIMQIIGCCFNNPQLTNDERFNITEDDFIEEFHKIVFGSIVNIHNLESDVTIDTIIDYLAVRPKYNAIFEINKGVEYLSRISQLANENTFNYYYHRMKKMTLLRAYHNVGIDVSDIYDDMNILDTDKKQEQEEWLDSHSLVEIADIIDTKISLIRTKYAENDIGNGYQAGDQINELIDNLKATPAVGIPMFGPLINTVTRGARLKKFYLRSAPSGCGKTRSMIADACNFGCDKIYYDAFGWVKNGISNPTLFITTEQEKSEIQTMMLAFLSNVNEEHILDGEYVDDEEERVREAAKILQNSPLWIEELPDFSLDDIESIIKKYIIEYDVSYIILDYIHSSIKILTEIGSKAGIKLREDNILFMLSTRLKDLCNKYGVFILSATQLSGDYRNSETPDSTLLRGAKSIGDKVDIGLIMLPPTDDDLVKLEPILSSGRFEIPNLKISVYKNRRGAYKSVYLWCYADLSTCRITPMFCTKWDHSLVSIEDIKIIVEEESAF